jgi:hypothetical protein
MMDELELLKRDWQKKEEHLPKLSYNEIYTMIWKKSSSIVKWIFYISLIELVFWILLNGAPFFMDSYQEKVNEMDVGYTQTFVIITSIIAFGVIFVFIYFLFKAYKSISVADNVRTLMESILKTRKIVHYYVAYNVVVMFLVTIYALVNAFNNDERMKNMLDSVSEDGSQLKLWLVMAGITLAGLLMTVGFIWVFYQLIYGLLLKKLNHNYRELKKLEI